MQNQSDYSASDRGAEYCDECVCLCVFVRDHIFELHISFFERVTCGHGLLLWPHNDTLLISGFMDVVLFAGCLQCFDTVGWAAGRASGL